MNPDLAIQTTTDPDPETMLPRLCLYLAFDDDDAALVVDTDAARVLQDVRAKLAHKLPVLVVDLDLMSRGPDKKKQHLFSSRFRRSATNRYQTGLFIWY